MFIMDDEDEDNPIVQGLLSVLNRSILEIGFYLPFDPTLQGFGETQKLLTKNPMPAMGSVGTLINALMNTGTEIIDTVGGADWDKTITPKFAEEGGLTMKERKDARPIGSYTTELLGLKHVAGMLGVFDTTDKDDTLLDYLYWGK
jgi:hypothetical protein